MSMKKHDDIKMYRAWIIGLAQGKKGKQIAEENNIPYPTLKAIASKINRGNIKQVNRCIDKNRLECLWKHKYFPRFAVIDEVGASKTDLICEMYKDGFGITEIAYRVGINSRVVYYHLNKKGYGAKKHKRKS